MGLSANLVSAKIMHARKRPNKHIFNYGVFYVYFDIDQMHELAMNLFSVNRWNLFAFYERDHGPRDGASLTAWIKRILADQGLAEADGAIRLLTLPRILGYVFNPVSFWLCFDRQEQLRAVLSEVSNTFGEHHSYLSFHDDHRAIAPDDWLQADKVFHVSPFLDVNGYYRFRFRCQPDKMNIGINYYDANGLMLVTSVTGTTTPMTPQRLLESLIRYPLVTLKVIGLIHMEAARLLFKGARYRPKPPPPATEVTR